MKSIAIIPVLAALGLIYVALPASEVSMDTQFEEFITTYGKNYMNEDELEFRRDVFEANMERAAELDALNPDADFGMTIFSDLTEDEMLLRMGAMDFGEEVDEDVEVHTRTEESANLATINHKKMFRKAQDQGSCGSCWAFAATGAFEGRHALKKGRDKTIKFSEQQALDCSGSGHGCGGGWYDATWKHLMTHKFCKAKDYPYTPVKGRCRADECKGKAKDKGYNLVARNEKAMYDALKDGPIAIALDATTWNSYRGGVMDYCYTGMTHAVVLVGYKSKDNAWVIRNSWSTNWGEKGYARLRYGKNTCNLTYRPAYPKF